MELRKSCKTSPQLIRPHSITLESVQPRQPLTNSIKLFRSDCLFALFRIFVDLFFFCFFFVLLYFLLFIWIRIVFGIQTLCFRFGSIALDAAVNLHVSVSVCVCLFIKCAAFTNAICQLYANYTIYSADLNLHTYRFIYIHMYVYTIHIYEYILYMDCTNPYRLRYISKTNEFPI